MKKKCKKNGYSYTLDDEKLIEFSKLSYGQRLNWFVFMHNLIRRFQPESSRIVMNKFRAGEI